MTDPDASPSPTPTGVLLQRTLHRARQLRRRRRSGFAAAAGLLAAAVAVPVVIATASTGPARVEVGRDGPPTSLPPIPAATTLPATPTNVAEPPPTSTQPARSTIPATPATVLQPGRCTARGLRITLAHPNGAAGSVGFDLTFANLTASACALDGYPGISYVDGSGRSVGAPAQRDDLSPVTGVILPPGQSAHAVLIETDALNYPAATCEPVATASLRVYPPGDTSSLLVAQATTGCANPAVTVIHIGPVVPG